MIPLLDCAGLPRALPSESASKLAHSKRPGDIAIGLGTRVAGWLGVDWVGSDLGYFRDNRLAIPPVGLILTFAPQSG